MGRKSKISIEIKIKACKDYKNGNGSFGSIAKSIGVSKNTVMQWYYGF